MHIESTRPLLAGLVLAAITACARERPTPELTADSVPHTATDSVPHTATDSVPHTATDSVPDTVTASAPARPPAPPGSGTPPGQVPDSASAAGWTVRDTRVTVAATGVATLQAVRTAAHPDFDRIVFEFTGSAVPSYEIAYVDRPVRQCGSGDVVPLAGDAWLSIQLEPAQAHTDEGAATVTERNRAPRLPNLLELKLICDFEAVVEWVGAVRSPERYRVVTLTSPTRLVVDIRHAR